MDAAQRRQAEIIGVLVGWTLLYMAVIGPFIGGVLPGFDKPLLDEDETESHALHRGELPDTLRFIPYLLFGLPVLFGYMYTRALFAGEAFREFWE